MRYIWLVGLVAAAVCLPAPVHAEITIIRGEYTAGVLIVHGETSQSKQRVTLDGRYSEWTDQNKRFIFRVRYLPRDCTVEIRAGRDMRPVYIANCEPAGAPPPAGRSRKAH